MYTFGIDIGSTTSKCVVMEDGQNIVGTSLLVGGIGTKSPERAVNEALESAGLTWNDLAATAATGYGRNRYDEADYNVSELSCHGLGAHHTFPTVRTIIDIGGQDAKVISLDEKGRMNNFLMNDKCAAGTGRFLDVMANILVVPVDEFAAYCERAKEPAKISSTCTVFAESEVISQLANGVEMEETRFQRRSGSRSCSLHRHSCSERSAQRFMHTRNRSTKNRKEGSIWQKK